MGKPTDRSQFVFDLCRGVFRDETWFRRVTTFVPDPMHRAQFIDFSGDWWYLDDLAVEFLLKEGQESLLKEHRHKRIFVPKPDADGTDILAWLQEQVSE